MSLRLTSSLLLLAAAPLASQLVAADPPTLTEVQAELQAKIAELDQQIRILGRNAELAKEDAEAAAAKVKAAIKPDDLQVKIRGYLQGRATVGASAQNAAGDDQDYFAGNANAGSESETARLAFRRIRLSAEFRSASDWFGLITLRADQVGTSGTASTGGAQPTFFQAFFGKTFKSGDFEHEVKFGLDKIYNNDSSISSTTGLLAVDRPLASLLASQREIGLGYFFRSPILRAGVEIQDNANLTRTATGPTAPTGNYDKKPQLATSGRIEFAPGAEYLPKRKQESYVGAYGTEVLLGFDYQNSGKSYAVANESRALTILGPDLLVHYDAFTFLAEYRISTLDREATSGTLANGQIDSLEGKHWNAQLGYVLPLDLAFKVEPAIRFSAIDWSKDDDEKSGWGVNAARDNNVTSPTGLLSAANLTTAGVTSGTTNLGSGSEIDLGLNLYWNGHANKTQLAYTSWKAEDGDGRAQAFIAQHQVTF